MTTDIQILLNDTSLSEDLRSIAKKVMLKQRISEDEGLLLYEHAPFDYLSVLSNSIRTERHGKTTYFNRNFHVEPTNICLYTCSFCSYSRLLKKREEGWEYTHEQIMDIIRSYDDEPVTEVHIVGGVLPQYDHTFYKDLYRSIKKHRPDLHIKALTPVEYHYIFKKAKLSYEDGMKEMVEAGLDSMPGGGAEIFHSEIRDQIAGGKCNAEQWLSIHEILHGFGKRSNATMLYGHIESYSHRIHHMTLLRELQDKTGGFQTFIPLKFRNKGNAMSHVPESSFIEDLRNYAISRIYLDNFDHIKAYWPMIGRQTAQMSLSFGVDDLDGTIDDTTKIYTMAGSEEQHPAMSTTELVQLINQADKVAVERDTLYNIISDYSTEIPEEKARYISLPVIEQ